MYRQGKWPADMAMKFIAATPERFADSLRAHIVESPDLAELKQP
jgi:hypothetical protein